VMNEATYPSDVGGCAGDELANRRISRARFCRALQ
jgi:hypothetical protein